MIRESISPDTNQVVTGILDSNPVTGVLGSIPIIGNLLIGARDSVTGYGFSNMLDTKALLLRNTAVGYAPDLAQPVRSELKPLNLSDPKLYVTAIIAGVFIFMILPAFKK